MLFRNNKYKRLLIRRISLDKLGRILFKGKFMSGDYETLEINQPKISYSRKISKNNKELLDELINKIEDIKNNISKAT